MLLFSGVKGAKYEMFPYKDSVLQDFLNNGYSHGENSLDTLLFKKQNRQTKTVIQWKLFLTWENKRQKDILVTAKQTTLSYTFTFKILTPSDFFYIIWCSVFCTQ